MASESPESFKPLLTPEVFTFPGTHWPSELSVFMLTPACAISTLPGAKLPLNFQQKSNHTDQAFGSLSEFTQEFGKEEY